MSQQTTTQWQAFLDTAKAKYATACDVYQTAINGDAATMESLTAAQDAYNAAGAQWTADQHTANQMAAVEPAPMTAAEVVATINTNEAFGVAWGADGQVLTYTETTEAIAAGRGWFDRQGRWVNKAGWEKQHAGLGAWLTAKLAE
jgi:hypothetical protein